MQNIIVLGMLFLHTLKSSSDADACSSRVKQPAGIEANDVCDCTSSRRMICAYVVLSEHLTFSVHYMQYCRHHHQHISYIAPQKCVCQCAHCVLCNARMVAKRRALTPILSARGVSLL